MGTEKRLVVISAGVDLPPLVLEFLHAGIGFTMILNTTADFALTYNQGKGVGDVWYHHEVVKLASAIVPDDLTTSSLAKIFSQSISQTRIPFNDAEMFLVQWVSERKKAKQSFYDFFKALNEYAGKSLEAYPLKFPEEVVTIKTPTSQVPLRYFQITGFVDRGAEQKTDLEELQNLLVESTEGKDKKKGKKPIELLGLDLGRDILTDEIRKVIDEADAILWLAEDPCSLALLVLHKEFTKTIKESKAPSTLVCPSQFTFREQFILQLLGVKPTLLGIAELCSGIVDHLVVGPDEASEVTSLRSKGFNVIMEDLLKIKDKKDLTPILKSMGLSIKDVSVESEEISAERTLEDLVTQLSYKVEPTSETEEDETETRVSTKPAPGVESDSPPPTVELLDTIPKNYDFDDTSLTLTQEMIEGLMQELSDEFPSSEQKTTVVIEEDVLNSTSKENEKGEPSIQYESQEAFTDAIQTLLKLETIDSESELVQGIGDAISKNADMATYAAKKLTAALETQHIQLIPIYVDFLKPRPLPFTKELLGWLLTDLESPDFVTFAQKVSLIISISKQDIQFIEQLLKQVVDYHITKSLSPIEREHVRTLIGMISARNVTLQRRAIRTYLSHYESPGIKPDEIWLGLAKFDAGLVALEIIEHQSEFGVKLVQEVLSRNLGSFGNIIYDVFHAYQKGDLQRVIAVAGMLSDALLRKKQREELAIRIRKIGSVPIETLAKNVEIDPKELEELVYEMINQNEINAKIDVVEGRLCIVQLDDKENEESEE
ncbi:MAG: PCI domain-containing protein [Candidatus Heimdallarchaeota archaeon]|nr:MAG: PCI domain-containing protein [Candidatus Heimdallarchaeota archaeon]